MSSLRQYTMDRPGFTTAPHPHDVRIVLLGKTGVGKSATGNTILGQEVFHSALGFSSVTMECQERTVLIGQNRVSVVDTPDFFYATHTQEGLSSEIERCIYLSNPGPHAFIFVLTLDTFTEQETDVVAVFEKCFGEAASRYSIIVFTHGDDLNNRTIDELVDRNVKLSELIEERGWRYHVLNNKDRANRNQVTELLEKILIMMNVNEGSCYTRDMLQESQRKTREESLREEERKREEHQRWLEKVRRETEDKVRREMEYRVRRETEDRVRREMEYRVWRETEDRVRREIEDRVRREMEYRVRREMEDRERRETEDRERRETEDRERRETEDRERRETEDRERRETEDREWRETEDRVPREMEEEVKRQIERENMAREEGEERGEESKRENGHSRRKKNVF